MTAVAMAPGTLRGRAHDWADAQEPAGRPLYLAALREGAFRPGARVLELGCGAGGFSVEAAKRGVEPHGVDPSREMVEIARARLPRGDFRVSPINTVPWPDQFFDGVAALSGFPCAERALAALSEARRVARPHALVLAAFWGRPEDCEIFEYLAALGSGGAHLDAPAQPEELAERAGLSPQRVVDVDVPFDYPDLASGLRGLLASAPAARVAERDGPARVAAVTAGFLSRRRTPGGRYLVRNRFRLLAARA